MTMDDYLKQLGKLQDDFEKSKTALHQQYATENNPYKKGDVITDHMCTIRIEQISWYLSSTGHMSIPMCCYYGIKLNKDGTPNKRGDRETIYQLNIIK